MTDEHKFPPSDLMMLPRWIVSDQTKKPIPGTAVADSNYWTNYDKAFTAVRETPSAEHMGITFHGGLTKTFRATPNALPEVYKLLCIDLDSCIEGHDVDPWARGVLDGLGDTYVERSPSGTGLHAFVWVRKENADYPASKHYIKDPDPHTGKAPQIQVIGGNDAGYVTITGDLLEGCVDTIAKVDDLQWMRDTYPPGKGEIDLTKVQTEEAWAGDRPDLATIAERVRAAHPTAERLLLGDWASIRTDSLTNEQRYPSASEAYFRLVCLVLKACARDGDLALDFLMSEHCGAWSAGNVPHSVDPGKYALRDDWVVNRVKKATALTEDERPEFEKLDGVVVPEESFELIADGEDDETEPPSAEDLGVLTPDQFIAAFGNSPQWLIQGLVPGVGVIQIFSQPKSGKSLHVLSWAWAVATGADDCYGLPVRRHGPVLILVGEDNHGVSQRLLAMCKLHNRDPATVPIYLTKKPANMSSGEGITLLTKQMEFVKPVFVASDTQIANAGAIDENDTKEMASLLRRCEVISQRWQCVFCLVHHTGKTGRGGARGSSAQAGAVLADYEVVKKGRDAPSRLIPRRSKNWVALDEFPCKVLSVEIGRNPDGTAITAPVIDYRVDPRAAADGIEPQEPADEVLAAPVEGSDTAADTLVTCSIFNGWLPRKEVVQQLANTGLLSAPTVNALRYLEGKLKGVIVVETHQRKGVYYRPV